jgi:hypothetical protein
MNDNMKAMTRDKHAALPYLDPSGVRTTGHSGSETSRDRALDEATSGTAAERRAWVLRRLRYHGAGGITVAELRDLTGMHHGQSSSVLSWLHKDGTIARLTERRGRCQVYVLPEYVQGRETQPHGRQKPDTEWEAFLAGCRCGEERMLPLRTDQISKAYDEWKAGQ